MRILLTGTTGQVGGALLPLLRERQEVVAPQRSAFDLSRPESLRETLDQLRPDLIVNPAAYTAVDRAEDEVELALRVNAGAPLVLADWAARHNVPRVHISTDYVFDGSGETPWREEDACQPLSSYGRSKWEGERAIQASGACHLIVRTSWVYAASGANFLRTISRLARERDELRIVADQFGAPTSAATIARAAAAIVTTTKDFPSLFRSAKGVVHLANTGTTTWHGFASGIVQGLRERREAVRAQIVKPIATSEFPTKALRPANSRLDLSRLRDVFGITTPTWQSALEQELDLAVGRREETSVL